MLLPHESTVAHAHERSKNEEHKFSRTRSVAAPAKPDTTETLVHTRPSTPTSITHCHDEDVAEDEDSDKKSDRSDEDRAK